MADTESIYPDTSSLTDLANLGRSLQNMRLHGSYSENQLWRDASASASDPAPAHSTGTSRIASPVGSWILRSSESAG